MKTGADANTLYTKTNIAWISSDYFESLFLPI